jgi:nucleotide-binding universal stress UspA family protein
MVIALLCFKQSVLEKNMIIKRILCPVDFSEFSHAANEYTSMLAKSTGARIIFLHTYLPEPLYGSPSLFDASQKERQILKKMEETYAPTIKEIIASYTVEFGTPADCIVHYANEYEIDMIVIGTHGRTGLQRVVMGSVAEAVVRKADCPVLAIKSQSKVLQES